MEGPAKSCHVIARSRQATRQSASPAVRSTARPPVGGRKENGLPRPYGLAMTWWFEAGSVVFSAVDIGGFSRPAGAAGRRGRRPLQYDRAAVRQIGIY